MLRAVSTYVYVKERLHPGLLDELVKAGAQSIEIFAARQHFDYANRKQHVREIADWFRSTGIPLNSVHAPLYSDYEWGRAGSPPARTRRRRARAPPPRRGARSALPHPRPTLPLEKKRGREAHVRTHSTASPHRV